MDNLSTGDILIYSKNAFFSGITKIFSLSNYDHVSIVIRLDSEYLPKIKILKDSGDLYLLESNTKLYNLTHPTYQFKIKKYHNNEGNQIFYRKIHQKYKTEIFYQKIKDYIKSNATEIYIGNQILKITDIIDSRLDNISPINIQNSNWYNNYVSGFCSSLALGFYNYILGLGLTDTKALPRDYYYNYNNIFDTINLLSDDGNYNYELFLFFFLLIIIIIALCYIKKVRFQ